MLERIGNHKRTSTPGGSLRQRRHRHQAAIWFERQQALLDARGAMQQ
jgi:hypothetical protein